ncbi:Fic/Doc-related protein [Clostridioides difficile]|nr:Fic/Doc-related protein [Clostridioides difficile]VIG64201.1 Fic/Doc-related protein [Clostridioides difficile]
MNGVTIINKSYMLKYTYKYPTNLFHGDKKYTLTCIKRIISKLVHDTDNLENNAFICVEVQSLFDDIFKVEL